MIPAISPMINCPDRFSTANGSVVEAHLTHLKLNIPGPCAKAKLAAAFLWTSLLAFVLPVSVLGVDYTNYIQIFSFGGTNGASPSGDLIEASDGLLYGTTTSGGLTNESVPGGMGTVFRIQKDGRGFQVLHTFGGLPNDGQIPNGGLLEGTNGLLYGTTVQGGVNGLGTIFAVNKNGTTYSVLKHFMGGAIDGANPRGGLVRCSDGLLYGTASSGDSSSAGMVYRIAQNGESYSVVSLLAINYADGFGDIAALPSGALVELSNGMVFGASTSGWQFLPPAGTQSTYGALFSVARDGTGLSLNPAAFNAQSGLSLMHPNGPLADAGDGYLYGTCGGRFNGTAVFRIAAKGPYWNFTLLTTTGAECSKPTGGLTKGPDGILLGTASDSLYTIPPVPPTPRLRGGVFAVHADGSGLANLKLFSAEGDGLSPQGKLLLASDLGLYGATSIGGGSGYGTIYALYPDQRSWLTSPCPMADQLLHIGAKGAAGCAFRLQFTTNILQPTWTDLCTNVSAPTGNLALSGFSISNGCAFYRLVTP